MWQTTVPLEPGVDVLTFTAYDFQSNEIGVQSVTVTRE
jgi:hypothetical protein